MVILSLQKVLNKLHQQVETWNSLECQQQQYFFASPNALLFSCFSCSAQEPTNAFTLSKPQTSLNPYLGTVDRPMLNKKSLGNSAGVANHDQVQQHHMVYTFGWQPGAQEGIFTAHKLARLPHFGERWALFSLASNIGRKQSCLCAAYHLTVEALTFP